MSDIVLTGFGDRARCLCVPIGLIFPRLQSVRVWDARALLPDRRGNGPIAWKDMAAVQKDIAHLKAALSGVQPTEVFMTAASPGVIAHFLRNEYYPSREVSPAWPTS